MTARGVDFLDQWTNHFLKIWLEENVLPSSDHRNQPSWLAKKLVSDAEANGFSVDDLEVENNDIETFIRDTLAHVYEPGMPGD